MLIPDDGSLLSVADAARRFSVAETKIRNAIKRHKITIQHPLPGHKAVFIVTASLEDYLAQNPQKGRPRVRPMPVPGRGRGRPKKAPAENTASAEPPSAE